MKDLVLQREEWGVVAQHAYDYILKHHSIESAAEDYAGAILHFAAL
jgi:hypothetical protein